MALAESQLPSSTADAISTSTATEKTTTNYQPGTGKASTSWADLVDRENQLPMEEDNVGFTKVGPRRKRPVDSETAGRKAKRGCIQADAAKQTLTERPMPKSKVQECTTTRQKQAAFRARSAATKVAYREFCPDFSQAQYLLALEAKLGKGSVYQLTKMEGHILVGLSSVQLADKLIEGLDIEDATLRAFPLRKKAESTVLGNIFFLLVDADLVAALRPYGQLTSIVQKIMEMGDSSWTDSRREAFLTHVYVTYGIECSLCYKQGHKRANCPHTPPNDTEKTEETVGLSTPPSKKQDKPKASESSQERHNLAEIQMDVLLKNDKAFNAQREDGPAPRPIKRRIESGHRHLGHGANGSDREHQRHPVQETVTCQKLCSAAKMSFRVATLNTHGIAALRRRIQLCCFLKEHEINICFLQETNVMSLDDVGDLCQGSSAVVAPTTTTMDQASPASLRLDRCSSEADSMAWQDGCHRPHRPGSLHDLQIIAALVRKEGAWILGDLNISEESAKDMASGSAEALAELLDQADLVDARRLDRILLPSGFCDRVTLYQTIEYAYSDHRAVLIQAPSTEETIVDFLAEVTPLEFDEWDQLFLADISRDQIAAAIHRLPNGRASGWDGLPCEFVKAFEDLFAEVLWQVFEASRLRGALPPSPRRSKVILLPKVHGGPGLQAFRPISLPTTDYRVLSGDGHPPGISRECDEAAGASRHNAPLAIISLDLKSAFDTLSRSYLFALLEKMGLPSTFLGIGVGPLLRRLERTLDRESVVVYADDIVLFIRDDAQFELVPLIFEEFRMSSGVAVNFTKSCGLCCGSWKHCTDSPLGISWTSESLTVLGCTITTRNTVASQALHLMGLLDPQSAEQVPERLSVHSQPGEKISPKEAIEENSSKEFSMEYQRGADPPAREMHASLAAARDDVTAPLIAASTSDTTASPASLNWADSEMAEVDANEGFTVVKTKKRRRTSSPEHAAKQPGRPAEKPSSQQQKRPTGPKSMPPQEIKATRANIAAARARQDTTNHENYIFVELCPDIPDYSYLKAIGMLVGGPGRISQFNRMNGHYVVGLATKDQASRLVEAGLDIDGTHLKVFPFRKRAERIVIANLPGFVEDSAIVEALRNFGTVTSIAPIMIKMGEYTFNDGRREAFILLREGVRLESLPTRMTIKSKGDTLSAFLSFGIKCSKCGKQGHRRANCPALARQGNGSPRQTATPTDARPPHPPPPPQQPRRPAPAPATPASPVQPAKTPTEAPAIPSAPHPAEPKDLSQPAPVTLPAPMAAPRPLEPAILPLDIEMSEEERTSTPSTPSKGIPAIIQLREHLEKLPSIAINHSGLLGLDWEDAQKLLASPTNMKKRVPSLLETQVTAFTELAKIIMDSCPNSSTLVYKTLQKTRTVLLIGRPK
ncbi:hypothetical protein LAZ67_2001792 [Cordylochernes scorpioides]|uniref:CCHC-type domain-containing protein n=1 Tax=Cordylochernes scorpioides TaxID=51811 RepID=A0ABY6K1J2_9ARAC|nr:hypothetical protein LAZ67_2001792 [Cordylochernes scorpioides]